MKKIMFNDKYGLTKTVLEGRKTMTRRICSKGAAKEALEFDNWSWAKYYIGEVVAVAQKYSEIEIPISGETRIYNEGLDLYQSKLEYEPGWTNKMFVKADLMPHRIRITNVRVERLQDISDEDVYKEGFTKEAVNNGWGNYAYHYEAMLVYYDKLGRSKEIRSRVPREAFAALIDKVSGKGTWANNPWVFVYEFELVK